MEKLPDPNESLNARRVLENIKAYDPDAPNPLGALGVEKLKTEAERLRAQREVETAISLEQNPNGITEHTKPVSEIVVGSEEAEQLRLSVEVDTARRFTEALSAQFAKLEDQYEQAKGALERKTSELSDDSESVRKYRSILARAEAKKSDGGWFFFRKKTQEGNQAEAEMLYEDARKIRRDFESVFDRTSSTFNALYTTLNEISANDPNIFETDSSPIKNPEIRSRLATMIQNLNDRANQITPDIEAMLADYRRKLDEVMLVPDTQR